jgi:hypothetical protein
VLAFVGASGDYDVSKNRRLLDLQLSICFLTFPMAYLFLALVTSLTFIYDWGIYFQAAVIKQHILQFSGFVWGDNQVCSIGNKFLLQDVIVSRCHVHHVPYINA